MTSSLSYHQPVPITEEEGTDQFKSPPIRTWKKFPPTTVDRIAYFPDSASTPYQANNRIESLGLSPLRRIRRHPCALSPIDRLKLGVQKRGREICKSFELNQTCPTSNIGVLVGLSPLNLRARNAFQCDDGDVAQRYLSTAGQHNDVSLSSIYSSNPGDCSLPRSSASKSQRSYTRKRAVMEKIRVDGANGLRFSARRSKGCFVSAGTGSPYSSVAATSSTTTNNNSSSGYAAASSNTNTTTSDSMARFTKAEMNPNKAVFTIYSKTSRILIVNKNACELLGYSSKELCELEFSDLLVNKTKGHVSALAEGQLNSEDGTLVLLSGKVVEMITKSGTTLAVSLWIRQIDTDGRCLAVAEPVERRVARLVVDGQGQVTSGDYEALMLFQMDTVEEFTGIHVTTLIPAIKLPELDCGEDEVLPKNVQKQKATGRTKDGLSFPLCLIIDRFREASLVDTENPEHTSEEGQLSITVFVFNNLSGLMVIDESGIIESCNHHFSMLMFGYAQAKIIGQHVSKVIPNFGQEYATDLGRSRNATISSLENEESETETDHVERTDLTVSDRLSSCAENVKLCLDFSTSKVNSSMVSELSDDLSNIKSLSSDTRSSVPVAQSQLAADDDELGGVVARAAIAKSESENLLCHENHENNRNLGNVAKRVPANLSAKAMTGSNALDSVCDNTFEEDYSQLMDNEILTPVNETEHFVGPGSTAGEQHPAVIQSATSCRSLSIVPEAAVFGPIGSVINDLPNSASRATHSKAIVEGELCGGDSLSVGSQQQRKSGMMHIQDGKYKGEAVHSDGNVIDIIYTVSGQTLPSGRVQCVWVSRDPDTDLNEAEKSADDNLGRDGGDDGDEDEENEDGDEECNQNLTLTFDSVNSTVENSLGQAIKATAQITAPTINTGNAARGHGGGPANAVPSSSSRPNSMSLLSQCEEELVAGEFSKHYCTLKQIGKGAYGYVKMAYRSTDRLLVIAKFILKEKLCPQFMVLTEEKREIPMEIYLLTTVEHPNIVRVLDVFENERFYQLVMEKHGCGMDLFEFIDRLPMMDEKLACHIFRQIANAVDYLHSLNILHRDLKDENIIIDQNFHVKLIDFGSATFLEPGKLFSTFYGTTEYCSPEVLAGNKYAGPELEMWSLGVTLYVIMFFENPFVDIEETLHAALVIPQKVSGKLEQLLLSMLDKNPVTRCTMRELIADPWLQQEINPAAFNFAWVVPCEAFESNPEKYYHGQAVSSGTALSTTSPQNSLSLVDGDSMLDVEEDDGGEMDDEEEELLLFEEDEPTGLRDSSVMAIEESCEIPASVIKVIEPKTGPRKRHRVKQMENYTASDLPTVGSGIVVAEECENGNEGNDKYKVVISSRDDKMCGSGGKRKGKKGKKKRANRRGVGPQQQQKKKNNMGQLKVEANLASVSLAMSKSENNLFDKSFKLAEEGTSNGLFCGYEGVVTSMRDLQFVKADSQSPTRVMNDFSRTQVLNTIAMSREKMVVGEEDRQVIVRGGQKGNNIMSTNKADDVSSILIQEEKTPAKQDSANVDWSASVELTPKSTNRSNFQILSISYTGGNDDPGYGYDEKAYDNDSWDEEEEEDDDEES